VPIGPPDSEDRIGTVADEFVSVATPADFAQPGRHYADFSPVSDDDVRRLLASRDPRHG
jgi:putative phosphoribosyl transferase